MKNDYIYRSAPEAPTIEEMAEDTKRMNRDKVGRPFSHSNAMFIWASILRAVNGTSYRQLEGELERRLPITSIPSHQTIFRRLKDIKPTVKMYLPPAGGELHLAMDATGLSMMCSGQYITFKWRKKANFFRLTIIVDVRTKMVLKWALTSDEIGETRHFKRMILEILEECAPGTKIYFYGDKAYDSEEIFRFCEEHNIKCIVLVRKNAVCNEGARGRAMREQFGMSEPPDMLDELMTQEEKLIYQHTWKLLNECGKRWAVEGAFSVIKRCMGESLKVRSIEAARRAVAVIISVYNDWIMG